MDPRTFSQNEATPVQVCNELNRITRPLINAEWTYDRNQRVASLHARGAADILRKIQGDLTKAGLTIVVGKSADEFMLRILNLLPDLEKLQAITPCSPTESIAINRMSYR